MQIVSEYIKTPVIGAKIRQAFNRYGTLMKFLFQTKVLCLIYWFFLIKKNKHRELSYHNMVISLLSSCGVFDVPLMCVLMQAVSTIA